MYIYLSNGYVLDDEDILILSDFDRVTRTNISKDFINKQLKNNEAVVISEVRDCKTFALTVDKEGREIPYFSPLNYNLIVKNNVKGDFFDGEDYVRKKTDSKKLQKL